MIRDLSLGFFSLFRGAKLIFSGGRISSWAFMPIIIGTMAAIGGMTLVIAKYGVFHIAVLAWLTKYLGLGVLAQLTSHLVSLLSVIALGLAAIYIAFLLTKLVSAPFFSVLAETVLVRNGIMKDRNFVFWHWLRMTIRMTAVNLIELVVMLVVGVILFIFSFIPVVNIATSFGFMLIMAYDSTDYALDVLHLELHQRLKYFAVHIMQFVGLALAMSLLILIPGVNFFLLAAAVAGSADLVSRNREFILSLGSVKAVK